MPEQSGTTIPDPDGITRAKFRNVTDGDSGPEIPVHFNPESLEYQVQNNADRRGSGNASGQYVSQSTGKLRMQLVFDTTATGHDVRQDTEPLQALMRPREQGGQRVAQVVRFEWGAFHFVGTFESYKETLDYFSATGVPLRAAVDISLAQQDGVFEPSTSADAQVDGPLELTPSSGQSADEAGIDRDVAARNGEDSLRFLSGASLSVEMGVNLRPPAAFASGSFGVSLGAGVDAQLGIGVGVSGSLGLSLGTGGARLFSASASVSGSAGFAGSSVATLGPSVVGPLFGSAASAGVPAALGAFAGLQPRREGERRRRRRSIARPPVPAVEAALHTEGSAVFDIGGRAMSTGPSGLTADVGARATLRDRIRFDEE